MPRPARRMRASAGAQAIISWISYVRVSTVGQGRSGLGLDAQKEAVARHIATAGGHLVAEFQEVESGKRSDRPVLTAALAACRARRAVLIVAKLDRLARNTKFLLTIAEGAGDGGVVFADLPQIPLGAMGKFFITLMAAVAELEAGLISQRTKAALAIAKARGVQLGNPRLRTGERGGGDAGRAMQTARSRAHAEDVQPYIDAARSAGATSLRQVAAALTARGAQPPGGGDLWDSKQVSRIERATCSKA